MNANGSVKRLRRTKNGRIIAGVCSGVGEYIGVDANILRIALAVASFFGGLGIGIYAVAWLLIPEEDRHTSIVQDLVDKNKDGHVWHDAKAKWDHAQQGRSQSSQPTGYEHHPYANPTPVSQEQQPQTPQTPDEPQTPRV